MNAMVLHAQRQPLRATELPDSRPGPGRCCCGCAPARVCRTDLHVVDGELPQPKLPLVPGHQIVGVVGATGDGVERFQPGERVGVPWLGWTCGACGYCRTGRENLCDQARFTGYDLDGGYAEYAVADERFCFPMPGCLLRRRGRAAALRRADRLPLAAHGRRRPAARPLRLRRGGAHRRAGRALPGTRRSTPSRAPGDRAGAGSSRVELGAAWAGGSDEPPPEQLDAAIIFAPAGELVPRRCAPCARAARSSAAAST